MVRAKRAEASRTALSWVASIASSVARTALRYWARTSSLGLMTRAGLEGLRLGLVVGGGAVLRLGRGLVAGALELAPGDAPAAVPGQLGPGEEPRGRLAAGPPRRRPAHPPAG